MRQIKFRLIKGKKIVGYEYHVVDKEINEGICVYHQSLSDFKNDEPLSKLPITGGDDNFIFHDKKEQFTGLKDKKGKEIYEGDIVKNVDIIGNIVFENSTFIIASDDYGDGYTPLFTFANSEHFTEEVEVIGNIYDNPELLKNPTKSN